LHMIETLKPNTGRMGVVVPHGVLFRGSSEGKIRQQLIEEGLLDAVIGLPEKLFYGTGIPAAILIFRKEPLGAPAARRQNNAPQKKSPVNKSKAAEPQTNPPDLFTESTNAGEPPNRRTATLPSVLFI